MPTEAQNLVKEVYKVFGKNRVLVPSHLRQLLDSLSPKPWQDQVKGEAWKLTRVQQKLEKLLSAQTLHKKAWQDFEADLQKYHQRNHLVYVDGLKALDEDITSARQEEQKASSELQILTAAHPPPAAAHVVQDSDDEEDMDQDGRGSPTHAEASDMERRWYQEEAAAATAAAQLHYQQAQAEAAYQQEAHQAAQQTAFVQAQAAAAEAAVQQAAFQQAQSVAAEAMRVAQQVQATQLAEQQQAWQQQQLLDLQRLQATQAQRQQIPGSEGAAEEVEDEEDSEHVLPTFTPVTMRQGPALRGFRATSEAKRQATDAPLLGFPMAEEDKKED